MSEGRELLIRAIKNGIVIDHIPSEKVFAIVEILKLKEYSERITVATNMPSSSLGRKGIIKIGRINLQYCFGEVFQDFLMP